MPKEKRMIWRRCVYHPFISSFAWYLLLTHTDYRSPCQNIRRDQGGCQSLRPFTVSVPLPIPTRKTRRMIRTNNRFEEAGRDRVEGSVPNRMLLAVLSRMTPMKSTMMMRRMADPGGQEVVGDPLAVTVARTETKSRH